MTPLKKKKEQNPKVQIIKPKTTNRKIRLLLSLISIILYYIINQTDNQLNRTFLKKGNCVLDRGFKLSKKINKLYLENKKYNKFSKIIGSLLLDISFLLNLISWCLYDKYWSNVISICFFYSIRSIIQSVNRIKIPFEEGYEWKYPNFPSICVNYFISNDYFWSGHVGICIICGFFSYYRKQYILSTFSFFAGFYEAILVLESRTHYTIDIPFGFIIGHYTCIISHFWCMNFNYYNFKKIFNCRKKKKNEIVSEIDIEKE